MLRIIKNLISSIVRTLVYFRVKSFRLNLQQAEYWASIFKRYPGVFPSGGERFWKELPDGLMMNLGVVDHIERHLLVHGEWDAHIGEVIKNILRPGDTFLDVGANIGYFSLFASNIVGDAGRVIAVEPSPRVLSRLALHIHKNNASQVSILSVGAGSEYSFETLVLATESNTGGSSIHQQTGNRPIESIAVVPIGEIINELKLIPSLIKIDVEGFEIFALQGLSKTIQHQVPIICEVTNELLLRQEQSTKQLLNMMRDQGYCVYLINVHNHSHLKLISSESDLPEHQFDVLLSIDSKVQLQEKYNFQVSDFQEKQKAIVQY